MCLEYPKEEEEEGHASGPTLSASTATGRAKSRKKTDLKRGQHGRHQVTKKVHAILRIGPHGESLEPQSVIGTFSIQCSYIAKEHVPITYLDWKKVPKELKDKVWTDIKKYFQYPPDQFNEDLCRGHALFIASRALRTLRSRLNNNYVKKGKTPFEDYNFIKRHIWDEFVKKMSTDEVKAKSEKFSDLAKKNELLHHLGMTGYAGKRPRWRQEEREAEAARQGYPLQGVGVRTCNNFFARRPKKLKEVRTKYNES
jgi:ribosomal protein L3